MQFSSRELKVPPIDAEASGPLAEYLQSFPRLREGSLDAIRESSPLQSDSLESGDIEYSELTIPGPPGAPEITLLVAHPSTRSTVLPVVFCVHGGGMVSGNRGMNLGGLLPLVEDGTAILISVEYRLAPEHPFPAAHEDCYAGLVWTSENLEALGGMPGQLILVGSSAGGGLAAGCALRARDECGPGLLAQVLVSPMLDDRMATVSSRMLRDEAVWDAEENRLAWSLYQRGGSAGNCAAPHYAAPARLTDAAGLPRTYIEVGTVDTFRDEAVAYAQTLTKAGIGVDLHMWGGAFHAIEGIAPDTELTKSITSTRLDFIRRVISDAGGSATDEAACNPVAI